MRRVRGRKTALERKEEKDRGRGEGTVERKGKGVDVLKEMPKL